MKAVLVTVLGLTFLGAFGSGRCDDEEQCYDELGCFPNGEPWKSLSRPFPAPATPTEINTHLFCFTRASPERYNITLWPSISVQGLPFQGDKTTVFITHGFASSSNETWMNEMKDAYLKSVDANVCLVDWSGGAQKINYLKVASNTRIVGAEIARFIKWLQSEYGLSASKLHLIGHSLGGHISSYAAKAVGNVFRITGLDTAQPGFEGCDKEVRLDESDADFVDAIHTNGAPLFFSRGFGLVQPTGDVDFYMNGGRSQPGCGLLNTVSEGLHLAGLSSLADITVEQLFAWVGCSHGRAFEYFIQALREDCPIWGLASSMKKFKLLGNTKVKVKAEECTPDTCVPLGLHTPQFSGRGVFTVTTPKESPFCTIEENSKIVARLTSMKDSLSESTTEALAHFPKPDEENVTHQKLQSVVSVHVSSNVIQIL